MTYKTKHIELYYDILNSCDLNSAEKLTKNAYKELVSREEGKMNGWLFEEELVSEKEKIDIKNIAKEIRDNAQVLLVIGIGGSYLGAKAAIDYLSDYYQKPNEVEVIFIGNSLSEKYIKDTANYLEGKDFYINVISKSGGTLEPAVAFRYFKALAEKKYGDKAKDRIIATTGKEKTSILRNITDVKGYRSLVVPDIIGGRYSVLTPVGLLPIAVAGFDIDKLLKAAMDTKKEIDNDDYKNNPALIYASIRHMMYMQGKDIEVYSTFNPNMRFFMEWLKQLYGESECKQNLGIFPASLILTSDLHSMGQLMQEGKRNIFETFINANDEKVVEKTVVEKDNEDLDKLNYIAGKRINELNIVARKGTEKAHLDGGVPVINISVENQNEETLGALIFFFEFACAVCSYMQGVNPFNQPGVEAYKKNIKDILNKG